jgi:hypothetical protein
MTVTLKFEPEVEAGLLAQAQASGMSVGEYALSRVAHWFVCLRLKARPAPRGRPEAQGRKFVGSRFAPYPLAPRALCRSMFMA